jgi:uncharacterized membrane protein
MLAIENKYLRPVPTIIIGAVIAVVLLYVGDLIAGARSTDAYGLEPQDDFGTSGWVTWVGVGAVLVYLLYVWAVDKPIWQIGTREVVYMAVGAALYGLTSWAFNAFPVPSVSLVSLRPTIVIPIFFGFSFGPVVGFFTGFVGNVLGDALTGWGVFPAWDIGNGLVGMIPGLVVAFKNRDRALNVFLWIGTIVLAVIAILALTNPDVEDQLISGETMEKLWWLPVLGVVLLLVIHYVPMLWPIPMALAAIGFLVAGIDAFANDSTGSGVVYVISGILIAGLAYLLYSRRESIAEALSDNDTKTIIVWGTLGVIIGIGFAATADIWINGYTPLVAYLGEFLPAGGPNIIFAIVLAPLLYGAWKQAEIQSGR